MHTSLTIYKASAGSGKTFTLAVNYMKILIQNPLSFRSILAVTFTNKATEEMKLRILSQLYGLSKKLPTSQPYLDKITTELHLSADIVSHRAEQALTHLLHNYNYFRVETIDTFFQSILRNLSRELDLTANLRVGLNDLQVEQQAVDELIEGLTLQSKELTWVMSYIRQNISDDKNWNVIGQIKRFGENIFRDVYKENWQTINALISDDQAFDRYVHTIRGIKTEAQAQLSALAAGFEQILTENNLAISDFSYKESGVCSYFLKLKKGIYSEIELLKARVLDAMERPEAWVSKKDQNEDAPLLMLVREVLFPYLQSAEKTRRRQARLYQSAVLTLCHLDQLRLLGKIEAKVRELNETANRFLLSDTQMLLHALVQDSDTPFIFEKIGTQLEHIMIDEFQDTSTIQWKNFKVLLRECLSRSHSKSLIVGDVKQSIYRWRSGDWQLLNNIETQFRNAPFSFSVEQITTNYRSQRHIVAFNNAFFKTAAAIEHRQLADEDADGALQLQTAYEDVEQSLPPGRPKQGRVEIRLFSTDKTRKSESSDDTPADDDAEEQMLTQIGHTIETLLSAGAQPKDIAILVRSNHIIARIADHLMQQMPHVQLVSDEGFQLSSSLAVNLIIAALRVLAHPSDRLFLAHLATAYQCHILKDDSAVDRLFYPEADLASFLPPDFWLRRNELLSLPIHLIIEHIYRLFHLDTLQEQATYVCTFYDRLNRFLSDNTADLDAVLLEWDTDLKNRTIQSDVPNGIRLLTIHKSKGLEFAHVIVPFCDWKLEKPGGMLWCTPREAPFSEMPIIPVDFSAKKMQETIFEPDYRHEHLQNIVDNLNLLYVAFTRAGHNLFVYGKQGKQGDRSFLIGQCLQELQAQLPQSSLEETADGSLFFSFGSLSIEKMTSTSTGEAEDRNIFNMTATPLPVDIHVYDSRAKFRQSNRSAQFLSSDDPLDTATATSQSTYIQLGTILHAVFAQIRTLDDAPAVLRRLELEGVLYDNQITRPRLLEMLNSRLHDPRIQRWFAPGLQLFNECVILSVHPLTGQVVEHRPDRVVTDGRQLSVIDFKFGRPHPEHREQVIGYMSLLSRMGHTHITGYLWYVYSNEIVEIDDSVLSNL